MHTAEPLVSGLSLTSWGWKY